jgi:cysteinyl-tRNA synthetase
MSVVLYNTLSRKKEPFEPLTPGQVKLYVCGPTVYDFLHIGNFRGAIFFSMVAKWLEHRGFKVTYVYNYTDVDDKIIKKANAEGVTAKDISERFIAEFEKDYKNLKLRKHDHNPKVSEFMGPIVEMIGKLIEEKKAYVVDGEVLYSVKSFDGYGKLSGKNIDELLVGARVEIGEQKENALDFALWKPAKPGEPEWDSPWSKGRPGWHIECSAMIRTLLGEQIDIHGGGIDLIFPHHENEIAQTEGCTHKPFVKYWMHNNFINFGAHKMSKSLGNITTGRAFMQKYNPEILKALILSSHYRSHSDFSEAPIHHAISQLSRIYSSLAGAEDVVLQGVEATKISERFATALKMAKQKVEESFDDDFNTSEVFAAVFELVRVFNSTYRKGHKANGEITAQALAFKGFVLWVGQFMSLWQEPAKEYLRLLDDMLLEQKNIKREDVDAKVQERAAARANKDFATGDKVRDELLAMGIEVQDSPTGTQWEVKK